MPLVFLKILLISIFAAACTGQGRSAAPPAISDVTPLEGRIEIKWTATEEGAEYWLFYAPSETLSQDNWVDTPGSHVIMKVTSPYTLTGLQNDTKYSFFLNARIDGGPGGAPTPTLSATPRLAGGIWNDVTGTPSLNAVAHGSRFVAVGDSKAIYSSTDGKSWEPFAFSALPDLGFNGNFNAITYGNGLFVALGYGDNAAVPALPKALSLTSTDGLTWSSDTAKLSTAIIARAVAFNGTNFVAVGDAGKIVLRDTDPKWSDITSTVTAAGKNLAGVTYAAFVYTTNDILHSGRFVAVGDSGVIILSSDESGTAWVNANTDTGRTANFKAVAFGNGVLVAVANGEVWSSLASSGGLVWSKTTTTLDGAAAPLGDLVTITYGTQFITVDGAGKVYTSKDGTNWSTATPITGGINAKAIARGDNHYVAVGNSGKSWTSY